MTPLFIFDLDGTLALIEHRRQYVEGPKKNWPAFFLACTQDRPNWPVITTLHHLSATGDTWIWSGRSDEVRPQTVEWLKKHCLWVETNRKKLMMRKAGDHQPDTTLKKSWLDGMSPEDRKRLVAVFDDRNRLVQMYRENGVACFQVAEGDF